MIESRSETAPINSRSDHEVACTPSLGELPTLLPTSPARDIAQPEIPHPSTLIADGQPLQQPDRPVPVHAPASPSVSLTVTSTDRSPRVGGYPTGVGQEAYDTDVSPTLEGRVRVDDEDLASEMMDEAYEDFTSLLQEMESQHVRIRGSTLGSEDHSDSHVSTRLDQTARTPLHSQRTTSQSQTSRGKAQSAAPIFPDNTGVCYSTHHSLWTRSR